MYTSILFDLDGTLTDPKLGITSCVQYALKAFGIIEDDLDKLEPFIGPPLKEQFMKYAGLEEGQAILAVEKYRERFQDIGIYENEIYDGIEDMLKELKKAGKKVAIASSKPTVFCERIAEYFQIKPYFDLIMGSELNGFRSRKADVIAEALKLMGIDKDEAISDVIMVGDREHDVLGAKEVGIACIGVSYGYGGREELEGAGAVAIVDTVEGLANLLV